ncbi:ABC transporter ATP-binding protein [Phyllobacterium lublinensis]|jgi:ABC-type branched-subunit amino acid transport system ATPase component|uniref:ABC transporter ATP-binding protein n=1 Tax=Phyllobacterium lublinensis TaxID=2875708 RepID=UPI00351D9574
MSILSIENVYSGYGDIGVINGISLSLDDGEFLGIFGHNGMGKSTLLKTIAGLIPVKSGKVEFGGNDVTRLPVAKRASAGLGYVPQGRQIYPNLSGRDNLKVAALGARGKAIPVERIVALLPRLEPLLDRLGGVMSGGEQQILALGRCLIGNPKVILLDEPTEGIQPSIREEMIEALKVVRRETAISIVLVEQNIEFIRSLSDRILAIQKGTIIAELLSASASELEALEL